jgi:AcrR family transcriptional regulator
MSDVVTDSPARGSGREAAICRAALELLAEVGYDRMSMDAVANRARASKATIYRHWHGKYELVLDALRSRGVSEIAPIDTGSLRGDLLAVLHAIADGIAGEDIELMAGAVRAMRAAPELASCVRDSMIEDKRDVARVIVDRAIARRELPAHADPELLHQVAPAMILFQLLICAQPADEPYLEHVVDDVLTPLLTQPRTAISTAKGSLA